MEADYLTTDQVAELLGVSESRVRQLLGSGELVGIHEGSRYRGYWKIDPYQVELYQLTRKGPGAPKRK